MTDRQVAIQAWLNDPRSPATEGFNTSFSRPVGEGVPSGSETAQSLCTARVVLRKDPSGPGGYFILTSYPVEP
jgi:hypothetical protein